MLELADALFQFKQDGFVLFCRGFAVAQCDITCSNFAGFDGQ